ncbi:hypothetical protein IMCC3317_28360 [Kordia antarctica]|uniref:O-antigen ligase n=1 Tax=Kordia antarctica TaxID=1218801 RepID=A0A7L4ZLT4_9FLAO|nr:hypothetical protein [Kordia antarctica]QHI37457.1 hypothetical protein IMCC3317_28360 [Kordia antarctica]
MNFIKKNIDSIVIFFLMAFFVSDFLTSITFKLVPNSFYRYSGIVKLVFEIFMVFMIITQYKKPFRTLWFILGITASFIISQLLLNSPEGYNLQTEFLSGNIYFFNRYIYLLIFALFIKTIPLKEETYQKIYTYFEYFLYVNAIALICGYIFHIELFRSYEYTVRFGVTGFFSKPGEASYMYMIAVAVNYYFWITNKQKKYGYKLLFFIACSLCLGQKKMLLFLLLLGIVFLVRHNRYKKIFSWTLGVLAVGFFFFKETILTELIKSSDFWTVIYNESGLLSTVTSYRDQLLIDTMNHMNENWSFLNYIFGGLDFNTFKVEFEFIDLYIFMGIAGIIYYLYVVSMLFNGSDLVKRNLIIITFVTSLLSGGLLLNVTAAILFYIVVKYVMKSNKNVPNG